MYIHNSAISSHHHQYQLHSFSDAASDYAPHKQAHSTAASHMGTIAQTWSPVGALYHCNYQLIHFAHALLQQHQQRQTRPRNNSKSLMTDTSLTSATAKHHIFVFFFMYCFMHNSKHFLRRPSTEFF